VNPQASTIGLMSFDRALHAARIGDLVRSSGAHLGAVIDPDGEQLTIVDDRGRVLTDDEALLVLVRIVAASTADARIAVPVSASREIERSCNELGAKLTWTKLSTASLMDSARDQVAVFAGGTEGGFAFPDFLPAYDAVSALVHLLDLLARTGSRLSAVSAELPSVRVAHREVPTRFEQKGLVMRTVVERAKGDDVVLVDGVKTIDGSGWTLIVPDPELPVTHIYAEAESPDGSEVRAARAATEVQGYMH
jgi:mannose-1-phosphate guanylyltransferase/phosphomannomutase